MKKEALLAIGYTLGKDEIRQMRDTFRALDPAGTGMIDFQHLEAAMKRHGIASEQVEEIFKALSQESLDGQIEYTSFVAACLEKRSYLEHSALFEAFHRFRDPQTGYITKESLRKMVCGKCSDLVLERMIYEVSCHKAFH